MIVNKSFYIPVIILYPTLQCTRFKHHWIHCTRFKQHWIHCKRFKQHWIHYTRFKQHWIHCKRIRQHWIHRTRCLASIKMLKCWDWKCWTYFICLVKGCVIALLNTGCFKVRMQSVITDCIENSHLHIWTTTRDPFYNIFKLQIKWDWEVKIACNISSK